MYSFGIILFELFYPISTDFEKYKLIQNLKDKIFPKDFDDYCDNFFKLILVNENSKDQNNYIGIRQIITTLLDENPKNRFSASELKKIFTESKFTNSLPKMT